MSADTLQTRLDTASRSEVPVEAIAVLVRALVADGVPVADVYHSLCRLDDRFWREWIDARRAGTDDATTAKARHEAALVILDRMAGWCEPAERLFPAAVTPDPGHLAISFVAPFYMRILHGHYANLLLAEEDSDERREFIRSARRAISVIDTTVVDLLLADRNWRCRLAAAWFCGVKGWWRFSSRIGQLLVPSLHCYAGQAYCFALACFADVDSAGHLCRYLDKYLRRPDLHYDQHWAMPALMWIDQTLGTAYSATYTAPGGLWDQYIQTQRYRSPTLDECRHRFDRLITVTIKTFGSGWG